MYSACPPAKQISGYARKICRYYEKSINLFGDNSGSLGCFQREFTGLSRTKTSDKEYLAVFLASREVSLIL
jgi:hypothetical protein